MVMQEPGFSLVGSKYQGTILDPFQIFLLTGTLGLPKLAIGRSSPWPGLEQEQTGSETNSNW